jgi:hypothetical protein
MGMAYRIQVRSAEGDGKVTAADLLILIPWLVFAAGLAVIGWRLLVVRRRRRDSERDRK